MRLLAFTASLLMATAAIAADAPAKPKLTPTQEIFVVYEIMCVKTGGKLAKATPVIASLEKSKTIKPVAQAEAEKLFKKGDKVWATKTSETPMFVVYNAEGICALHIQKADAKALKNEYLQYVNNVHKGMKDSVVLKKADDKKQADSLFSYYVVTKPGAKSGAGFGLSTSAPEAQKSPQHLLTFNLAKPE